MSQLVALFTNALWSAVWRDIVCIITTIYGIIIVRHLLNFFIFECFFRYDEQQPKEVDRQAPSSPDQRHNRPRAQQRGPRLLPAQDEQPEQVAEEAAKDADRGTDAALA